MTTTVKRPSGRSFDEIRAVSIETDFNKHAEGSCLIRFGDTHVLCTATVDASMPRWMRNSGKGWITAEYGMLPRSTHSRSNREAVKGKQSGRTQEIQRLIGRSLRAVTDLTGFGERQIKIDCDVIQADGGTRTASITGAYVALYLAFQGLKKRGVIEKIPLIDSVAAVSCGLFEGQAVTDLDYDEDSNAEADANFVLTASLGLVEVQATAEDKPFKRDDFNRLLDLAEKAVQGLVLLQKKALGLRE